MTIFRSLRRSCLGAVLAVLVASAGPSARAAEIWLSVTDPFWREHWNLGANDYHDLFAQDAPWAEAAKHVNVFRISDKFVLTAPAEQLQRIFRELERRRIALAVQGVALVHRKDCGQAVEGYAPPDNMLRVARRIRELGGKLDAVALDEPLFFGHFFREKNGKVGCAYGVDEIAQQVARKVNDVRTVFPDVRVGELEPVAGWGRAREDAVSMLGDWYAAYERATGRKMAFTIVEIIWPSPNWRPALKQAAGIARSSGVPFGVIYNGQRRDDSDEGWVASARRAYTEIEDQLGIRPEIAAFITWTDRPRRLLPETQDGTMTNLVLSYLRWRKAAP